MDHVGPLARDVETAALGLDVVADPLPGEEATSFAANLGTDLSDLTVGVEERFFAEHVSPAVEERVREAIEALERHGAEVREVDVPALEYSREAWWGIAPAEFAASVATNATGLWRSGRVERSLAAAMARIRQANSRDLGTNIKEMLALGQHVNQTHDGYHYVRGRNLRAALRDQFDAALESVDVIAAPATPTTALEIGGFERGVTPPVNWDTHPTNLTGHPSVSVPCGETDGLPVGLQFVGACHDDQTVVDAAYSYEQEI
jgi:Asp-tRNA(Asn)/Glu-tRNA(Gln) amidotransferase A subunit family amidase